MLQSNSLCFGSECCSPNCLCRIFCQVDEELGIHNYTCDCLEGWMGFYCDVSTTLSCTGDSWVAAPHTANKKDLLITLSFRWAFATEILSGLWMRGWFHFAWYFVHVDREYSVFENNTALLSLLRVLFGFVAFLVRFLVSNSSSNVLLHLHQSSSRILRVNFPFHFMVLTGLGVTCLGSLTEIWCFEVQYLCESSFELWWFPRVNPRIHKWTTANQTVTAFWLLLLSWCSSLCSIGRSVT